MVSLALQASNYPSELIPFALFVAWGCCGIAGEVLALVRSFRTAPTSDGLSDSRPADGVVGVARMLATAGSENVFDPRFRRFDAFEPNRPFDRAACLGTRGYPRMLGRIAWTSLFIGRDGRPWMDHEIAKAHTALTKAATWLEREAIRWHAAVNIELADTYFIAQDDAHENVEVALVTHGDRYAPADADEPDKLLNSTSRAAARLGFRDAVDWLANIQPRLVADVHVWLVLVRRGGCSQVVTEHDTESGSIRLAVCYARETLYPEPLRRVPIVDPVTIAHEVLHLFGATDKYEVPLRSFPSGSVTSRDVMRLSKSKLSRLRIDPKTAAEIGWVKK